MSPLPRRPGGQDLGDDGLGAESLPPAGDPILDDEPTPASGSPTVGAAATPASGSPSFGDGPTPASGTPAVDPATPPSGSPLVDAESEAGDATTVGDSPLGAGLDAQQRFADAERQFGLKLYDALRSESGNLFFSPLSAHVALLMTAGGARGSAKSELTEALCLDSADELMQGAPAALVERISKDSVLRSANALWADEQFPFEHTFMGLIQSAHGAGLFAVDFGDAESTRARINGWVEDQTEKRIVNLIADPSQVVGPLILVNALYMKAAWPEPFGAHLTAPKRFFIDNERWEDVPTMSQTGSFGYYEDDDVQVLETPYDGNHLAMTWVLPRRAEDLDAVEAKLPSRAEAWTTEGSPRLTKVELPKFELRWSSSLVPALKSMGLSDSLTSDADFSGITSHPDGLYIGDVIQQAFIKLDEEGTEAAAATAVMMLAGSAPGEIEEPVAFIADHPFLIMVRSTETGAILFMGRVMNPEG